METEGSHVALLNPNTGTYANLEPLNLYFAHSLDPGQGHGESGAHPRSSVCGTGYTLGEIYTSPTRGTMHKLSHIHSHSGVVDLNLFTYWHVFGR